MEVWHYEIVSRHSGVQHNFFAEQKTFQGIHATLYWLIIVDT